jgi:hypothetical protein
MPLLRILAKGQDENSTAAGRAGGSVHDDGALGDCDASLGGVTVFILDHPIGSRSLRSRYDPDQYDALRRAASALEASGVTVKPLPTDVARRFTRGESCVSMHLYYSMCLDDNALGPNGLPFLAVNFVACAFPHLFVCSLGCPFPSDFSSFTFAVIAMACMHAQGERRSHGGRHAWTLKSRSPLQKLSPKDLVTSTPTGSLCSSSLQQLSVSVCVHVLLRCGENNFTHPLHLFAAGSVTQPHSVDLARTHC